MSRPLLVTDCDEVLLHMIGHFADWVAEAHGYSFDLGALGFREALSDASGAPVPEERVWPLLDLFFEGEMHRQNVVPGAVEALERIAETADIVILTNIGDEYQAGRIEQLGRFGISHRVLCNRGGKAGLCSNCSTNSRPAPPFSSTISPSIMNRSRSTRPESGACT